MVIDVLRATSTATQALAAGYERILCTDTIDRARALRAPSRLVAGERRCLKPDDFDLGNSPRAVSRRRADELVLATTNGTPAIIAAASRADSVMLGCMLNLGAVIDALGRGALRRGVRTPEATVQIVCAGSEQDLALEDVYVAGRLCAKLPGPRTDAARVAQAAARLYATPLEGLNASAHGKVLGHAGLASDVAYCALESTLTTVPLVTTTSAGVAVLVTATSAMPAPVRRQDSIAALA